MTNKKLVLTTAGSAEEARKIAHTLVEGKLAACVNIVPQIQSVYRWQGKTEEAQEWLLIIKTTDAAFERVKDAIKKMHSYEVPECIAVEIENGSPEYLNWITESVEKS
ncbi:MAG: CutA1 divalent ion tolerance protein [Acidobacteriaceae bacterium]|nr:CutA1 divalent ion tolerance protein [Acidobacteriaceae bacterium]